MKDTERVADLLREIGRQRVPWEGKVEGLLRRRLGLPKPKRGEHPAWECAWKYLHHAQCVGTKGVNCNYRRIRWRWGQGCGYSEPIADRPQSYPPHPCPHCDGVVMARTTYCLAIRLMGMLKRWQKPPKQLVETWVTGYARTHWEETARLYGVEREEDIATLPFYIARAYREMKGGRTFRRSGTTQADSSGA